MTKKQLKLIKFVKSYIKANEVPPSYDEIKDHLNIKAKSQVHYMVRSLVKQHKLYYQPNVARSIWIPGG